MEQKKHKNKRQSYGTVILLLLLTCFAVSYFSRHHAEQGSAQDSDSAWSAAETTPAVTFSPIPEITLVRTVPTQAQLETTEAETAAAAPAADSGWMLTLVNRTHPVPDGWETELVELRSGISVDARMYPALQKMFDSMRAQGIYPLVREGYRTREYQQEIMADRIRTHLSQGCSEDEAKQLAEQYVAKPGTSEHELGLAVDINAAVGTDSKDVYSWLAEHAPEFGFILRYPEGKSEITGIAYEPWHFRYVGEQAAAEITAAGLTLEEYLGEA